MIFPSDLLNPLPWLAENVSLSCVLGYIDPGTGSMLFSILIGIVAAAAFFVRKLWIRLKFLFRGGRMEKMDAAKLPLVIFSDSKRYQNVFYPIRQELERRGVDCEFWTASPDDPALSEEYHHVTCRFIGEGNKAYSRLNMMNAGICLATTPGLDVYQWKRSKNTDLYVHVQHSIDDCTVYRMFGTDYFDAVLCVGDFVEQKLRKLEERWELPSKEYRTVGAPFMDYLQARYDADHKEKTDDSITVLVAPSWGPSSLLNLYGEELLDSLLATGYKIVVRPHPQSQTAEAELLNRLMAKYPEEKVHWNFDNDNFACLDGADIMISDFSAVVFDYALVFDKPFLYAVGDFDDSPYDAHWLEDEAWNLQVLPRVGRELRAEDMPNLKSRIDEALRSDLYAAGREELRSEAWPHRGHGAEKIVDYLMGK